MRARASKDGLTLRLIAGTNNVLLAMDLSEAKRAGCLGFTIERTDLDTGDRRWLPNLVRFPSDPDGRNVTSARAPIQKFRWGDYTTGRASGIGIGSSLVTDRPPAFSIRGSAPRNPEPSMRSAAA